MIEKRNIEILKALVKTDYKLRYQGSLIGHLWSIFKPLCLFSIMYFVFAVILKLGQNTPHFPVAMLLAVVLWGFFTETSSLSLFSMVSKGDLLRKVNFPSQIIVYSISVNALINLLINLGIVLILGLINRVEISPYCFLFPLLIVELFLFTLGVSFILATVFVRIRDIAPLWEVSLQALMYLTPVIYPITEILKRSVIAGKIVMLNPIAQIIQDSRYLLISTQSMSSWEIIGNKYIACVPYFISILVFIIGYRLFIKQSKKFAELV